MSTGWTPACSARKRCRGGAFVRSVICLVSQKFRRAASSRCSIGVAPLFRLKTLPKILISSDPVGVLHVHLAPAIELPKFLPHRTKEEKLPRCELSRPRPPAGRNWPPAQDKLS